MIITQPGSTSPEAYILAACVGWVVFWVLGFLAIYADRHLNPWTPRIMLIIWTVIITVPVAGVITYQLNLWH